MEQTIFTSLFRGYYYVTVPGEDYGTPYQVSSKSESLAIGKAVSWLYAKHPQVTSIDVRDNDTWTQRVVVSGWATRQLQARRAGGK